jgi:signal transduction protein with GAF and PtsI domain
MDQREGFVDTAADTGQVERLMACIAFSKVLAGVYDMETLLTAVLQRINVIVPARNWSLLLIDPKTKELYFAVVVGVAPEAVKDFRLKPGEGIAGAVVQTGQPLFIPDANQDPRFCPRVDSITGFDTRPAPDRSGRGDRRL